MTEKEHQIVLKDRQITLIKSTQSETVSPPKPENNQPLTPTPPVAPSPPPPPPPSLPPLKPSQMFTQSVPTKPSGSALSDPLNTSAPFRLPSSNISFLDAYKNVSLKPASERTLAPAIDNDNAGLKAALDKFRIGSNWDIDDEDGADSSWDADDDEEFTDSVKNAAPEVLNAINTSLNHFGETGENPEFLIASFCEAIQGSSLSDKRKEKLEKKVVNRFVDPEVRMGLSTSYMSLSCAGPSGMALISDLDDDPDTGPVVVGSTDSSWWSDPTDLTQAVRFSSEFDPKLQPEKKSVWSSSSDEDDFFTKN